MTPVVDAVVDSEPAVDNQKKIIGERLKQARGVMKMTQKDLVIASGIPLPSLRDYEGGKRMPGGDAIASIVKVGINANWLLAGHGPMLWRGFLDRARDTRDAAMLAEHQWAIVRYALSHVDRRWFVTAVSEPDHGLNKVVDDYNTSRILNDEGLRRAIPSITIENLGDWGREAITWHARLKQSPLSRPSKNTEPARLNIPALTAILEGLLKAGAPPSKAVAAAFEFYQINIDRGLITADGIGAAKENAA